MFKFFKKQTQKTQTEKQPLKKDVIQPVVHPESFDEVADKFEKRLQNKMVSRT